MSKLEGRIVEVPVLVIDAAAHVGVVLIDTTAEGFDATLSTIAGELKRDLGALFDALALVRSGLSEACSRENWSAALASLANDYNAASLEELAAVLEDKIAGLESMTAAVDGFAAESGEEASE